MLMWKKQQPLQVAPACANRSCGPPKPGAAYKNQPDGAAGGPPGGRRSPTGAQTARGDAVACPRGPNINCEPIRDSRATCRMTTSPKLRWKAHFFGRKSTSAKCDIFFGFVTTRQTAMPIQIVSKFCARGYGRCQQLLYQCQNPS